MYTTLIDPPTLNSHLEDPNWLIVDCRFNLAVPTEGHKAYLDSHIRFADLDQTLSHPPATDHGPSPACSRGD